MMTIRPAHGVAILGVALALTTAATAQRGPVRAAAGAATGAETTAKIVTAARAVLASLDEAGRAKVQFAFDGDAQRRRWSNLPSGIFERRGIRLGDLTPAQRTAVTHLLQVAFSA